MSNQDGKYALFIDIDGTLTGDNHIIPKRNIDAINAARALGHKVFINTGRSRGNIPPEVLSQVEFDGVLSGNGTMLTVGDKESFADCIPREVVNMIARHIYDNPPFWAAFEGVNKSCITTNRDRPLSSYQTPVATYEDYLRETADDGIQVIAVSSDVGTDYLDTLSEYVSYFTFDYYFDIVSKGNNKSKSMRKVIDMLGIDPKRTVAFGDSDNDHDMLKSAGIAVAMANAAEQIKEIADFVSLSNKEGGVGYAIEELILKKETV